MSESSKLDCAALLAQVDWVRALARHLVTDVHAADDLAQDALAAALVRPPPGDRPLRAWLAGVLRNRLRHERRSAGRRDGRERVVARSEGEAGGDELLERLESHRAVVEAVARLDEPYRTAILLRYFEGLAPAAIARRTGVPRRTVHTRLHRALAHLRAELDRAHGGERRTWLLALLPYARGAGGWSTAATGALVMEAKKFAVAALAVVGVCTTWVLWRGDTAEEPAQAAGTPLARAPDGPPVVQPMAAEVEVAGLVAREALAPTAAVATSAPAPVVPLLRGRVLDVERAPVAGVRVRYFGPDPEPEAVSDASGAFTFERPRAGGRIDLVGPGWTCLYRPEFQEAPGERECVLVVARSVTLGGRVLDAEGRGIESASVAVPLPFALRARFDAVLDGSSSVERQTRTGPDGRFELSDVPVTTEVELVTSRPGFLDDRRPLPVFDELALAIVLARVPVGPERLLGRVLAPDGAPVEGAWVGLGQSSTKSGPEGAFALELGADDGGGTLRAVKAGFQPAELVLASGERPADPLVLELGPPPLAIRGRVLDAAGAPVPGAEVWTDEETHFGYVSMEGGEMTVRVGATVEGLLRDDPWTFRVRTDASGRFELRGLLPRDYRLRAFDRRQLRVATAVAGAGERELELRFTDEPRHALVAGRVTNLAGEALVDVRVVLERPALGGSGPGDRLEGLAARTDAEGRFAFEQVSREVSAVLVQDRELGVEGHRRPLRAEDDLARLELFVPLRVHAQVDAGAEAGAERAALLDASGRPLTLSIDHGEHFYASDEVQLDRGRSEAFSVSELAVTLVLYAEEHELQRVPVRMVRGELNTLRP